MSQGSIHCIYQTPWVVSYFTSKGVPFGGLCCKASSIRSPVDVALDGARLGPGVDCALDAGHGGVPCVVNVAGLELDLNYLSALFLS